MIQTLLFIDSGDPREERIVDEISQFQHPFPHVLHVVDISKDPILKSEFGAKAPVLDIGIYRLIWPFKSSEIEIGFLKSYNRLIEATEKGNTVMIDRITKPMQMTKADRFSRWFSQHYMFLVNFFMFLYVFLAVCAPIFMHIGWDTPGKVVYKIYRPLCHQLAFRSFFLFGEQLVYPRALANVDGFLTYGEATGFNEYDLVTAREFLGSDRLGYKIALCQRDIAIYGTIFLFGLVFTFTGNKIKPLPWYLWLILGLGPIGLDGFSQLLGQSGLKIFQWLPFRESTPLLRTMTGVLFGLATAWFGFPYLEETVQENRVEMSLKTAITSQLANQRSNH